MLFPFHRQAGKVQRKLHKLTSIDNCTEVLLPTQALKLAAAIFNTAAAIHIPVSPSPLRHITLSEGRAEPEPNILVKFGSGSRLLKPTPLYIARISLPPGSLPKSPFLASKAAAEAPPTPARIILKAEITIMQRQKQLPPGR